MSGIYYWKDKIKNEYYVGQAVDIDRRKKQHLRAYPHGNNKLYVAMREDGLENFDFGILEECPPEQLNDKEVEWIKKLNSYKKGLNSTPGGSWLYGANNPNTNLSNEDVLNIRQRVYLHDEEIKDVYEDYKSLISYDSFWSLVHGKTWKNVDTSMIKDLSERPYHNFDGEKNPKAALTQKEVDEIRARLPSEEKLQIYQDYKDKISYSAFCKMCLGTTWGGVKTPQKKVERKGKPKAKLKPEDVLEIRRMAQEGISRKEIYNKYSFITPKSIDRVIKYQTWKNL